eukprot:gnl/TRDRNA2_/TRDRNA2_145675_c1_seq1.p2 gnl/TRDRNA2_/TRDRNA2_145675_c1~~gnl/TRDRNA2_/TRDRNA2_145675_c1_seq1.p2  ORF type:complete len:155 (+),score=30.60 gnl/TRDRNA2_/TRDRNA2_145675_c1_seq1:70-465(+)
MWAAGPLQVVAAGAQPADGAESTAWWPSGRRALALSLLSGADVVAMRTTVPAARHRMERLAAVQESMLQRGARKLRRLAKAGTLAMLTAVVPRPRSAATCLIRAIERRFQEMALRTPGASKKWASGTQGST